MHLSISELEHHQFLKGLAPVKHQAIIWINAGLSLMGPLRNQNTIFFMQENEIINVICKMGTILFQSQLINQPQDRDSGELHMNDISLLYNSCSMIF